MLLHATSRSTILHASPHAIILSHALPFPTMLPDVPCFSAMLHHSPPCSLMLHQDPRDSIQRQTLHGGWWVLRPLTLARDIGQSPGCSQWARSIGSPPVEAAQLPGLPQHAPLPWPLPQVFLQSPFKGAPSSVGGLCVLCLLPERSPFPDYPPLSAQFYSFSRHPQKSVLKAPLVHAGAHHTWPATNRTLLGCRLVHPSLDAELQDRPVSVSLSPGAWQSTWQVAVDTFSMSYKTAHLVKRKDKEQMKFSTF